jgi:hypothetical protein
MAYIGRQIGVGNFVKLDAITATATTTFNLLNGGVAYYPQSANNCLVSLNGILQAPTDSFTISGSTIIFSSALTTSDVIDFIIVLGDVLNIGTPSDNTVSTAKLASGLVVPYGKGGTGLTTLGTANQVLAVNSGATALEFQSVSSDYVLLASTTASNVATLDLNGYFSSTYKNYKLFIEGFYGTTDVNNLKLRFATTGSYTVQTSSYGDTSGWADTNSGGTEASGTTSGGSASGGGSGIFIGHNSSNSSYRGNTEITIFEPLQTSYYHCITALTQYWNGSSTLRTANTSGVWVSTTAVTGVRLYFESGNLYAGSIKLYGIK